MIVVVVIIVMIFVRYVVRLRVCVRAAEICCKLGKVGEKRKVTDIVREKKTKDNSVRVSRGHKTIAAMYTCTSEYFDGKCVCMCCGYACENQMKSDKEDVEGPSPQNKYVYLAYTRLNTISTK